MTLLSIWIMMLVKVKGLTTGENDDYMVNISAKVIDLKRVIHPSPTQIDLVLNRRETVIMEDDKDILFYELNENEKVDVILKYRRLQCEDNKSNKEFIHKK